VPRTECRPRFLDEISKLIWIPYHPAHADGIKTRASTPTHDAWTAGAIDFPQVGASPRWSPERSTPLVQRWTSEGSRFTVGDYEAQRVLSEAITACRSALPPVVRCTSGGSLAANPEALFLLVTFQVF